MNKYTLKLPFCITQNLHLFYHHFSIELAKYLNHKNAKNSENTKGHMQRLYVIHTTVHTFKKL